MSTSKTSAKDRSKRQPSAATQAGATISDSAQQPAARRIGGTPPPTIPPPAWTPPKYPKKELRAFGELLAAAMRAAGINLDESQANHLYSVLYYAHVSVSDGYSAKEQEEGRQWALEKLTDIISYAGEAYPIVDLDHEDPECIKPSATLDPARRERMLGKRVAEAVEKDEAQGGAEPAPQ